MEPGKRKGPVRTQNVFIEVDILDRVKREAKYKKVPFQNLLNQILRETLFEANKDKEKDKDRGKKEEPRLKDCPHCGLSLKGPKVDHTLISVPLKKGFWQKFWNLFSLPSK